MCSKITGVWVSALSFCWDKGRTGGPCMMAYTEIGLYVGYE